MQRLRVRALGTCLLVLTWALPAVAQTTPKTELSGGYQFLSFSIEGESESLPKGWYFDVAGNVSPMLGLVFQVGGNYKSIEESVTVGGFTFSADADVKIHEFLGGVRLNARSNPALVPFGQLLVGGVNSSAHVTTTSTIPGVPAIDTEESVTNFALQVGGGANFRFDSLGIRVGAHYMRVFTEDDPAVEGDGGVNAFVVQVGLVFGR
jgi:hypothetical protein